MKKIDKYTDNKGVCAEPVLSEGEHQFMNALYVSDDPHTFSLVEFIMALFDGTWVGGNVQGFTQYITSGMFTMEETSDYVIFRPQDPVEFLSVLPPETLPEESRPVYTPSSSDGGGQVHVDMHLLENIRRGDVSLSIHHNGINMVIGGHIIAFADVVSVMLQVTSCAFSGLAVGKTYDVYITTNLNATGFCLGFISDGDYSSSDFPIPFNQNFNVSSGERYIYFSLKDNATGETVYGPTRIF